jgi:prepilin-type N-terminal cleavage/methylation domain-containing protein
MKDKLLHQNQKGFTLIELLSVMIIMSNRLKEKRPLRLILNETGKDVKLLIFSLTKDDMDIIWSKS